MQVSAPPLPCAPISAQSHPNVPISGIYTSVTPAFLSSVPCFLPHPSRGLCSQAWASFYCWSSLADVRGVRGLSSSAWWTVGPTYCPNHLSHLYNTGSSVISGHWAEGGILSLRYFFLFILLWNFENSVFPQRNFLSPHPTSGDPASTFFPPST